jgi:hypothetical protein
MSTKIAYNRGATSWVLSVVDSDGVAIDLTDATISFRAKTHDDDPDPPLILLTEEDGITIAAQSGDTLGQATVTISSALAETLTPGKYRYDVIVTPSGGDAQVVVAPATLLIKPAP